MTNRDRVDALMAHRRGRLLRTRDASVVARDRSSRFDDERRERRGREENRGEKGSDVTF